MKQTNSYHADGKCYFCGQPGTWRGCCNQYLCEQHAGRYDLRALGAGLELAKKVIGSVERRVRQKKDGAG